MMLRLLGIPARVAAGFVPAHYREGVWSVTDHDAHAWVEVWFRGYGWLPFDPTPGRGRLSGTYSSTSTGFNARAAAQLLAGLVKGGEVFGREAPAGSSPTTLSDGIRVPPETSRFAASAPRHRRGKQRRRACCSSCSCSAPELRPRSSLLKHVRRKLRYLTRDPRRIAAACARELAEYLQDQRFPATRRRPSTSSERRGRRAPRRRCERLRATQRRRRATAGRRGRRGRASGARPSCAS